MTKEPVHIRQKKLNDGNISLYLDIYFNGRRAYEFLKLYLIPEKGKDAKNRNKETMRLAETIKAQRIIEIQKGTWGFEVRKSKTGLIEYFNRFIEKKENGTANTYKNVLAEAKEYFGETFILERLTSTDITGFFGFLSKTKNKNYKGKTLSKTTIHSYCVIFKSLINCAIREGLLPNDVLSGVSIVGKNESIRQYLSIEELQILSSTELDKPFKRAFIFSCLTGLRKSDVEVLEWGDIIEQDGFSRIVFRQRKTKNIEYLDISSQAKQVIGKRMADSSKVFHDFRYSWYTNKQIMKWTQSVGITKKITFHSARHTFAVMMLTIGVDIYTTSKLLGHRELSTTQIYAKIIDKKKQDAVSKIPIIIKNPAISDGEK